MQKQHLCAILFALVLVYAPIGRSAAQPLAGPDAVVAVGVEQFLEALQADRYSRDDEDEFEPLRRLLMRDENRAAFVAAVLAAKSAVGRGGNAIQARTELRKFLRKRAYAIDVRFCRALDLLPARCEEVTCLVYGTNKLDGDTATCQAPTQELGPGPASPEDLQALLKAKASSAAWKKFASESGYGSEIPLIEEAGLVRSALDILALRIAQTAPNDLNASRALAFLDDTIAGYQVAVRRLMVAQSSLQILLDKTPFGEVARQEITRLRGPALVEALKADLKALVADEVLASDPWDHAGLQQRVDTSLGHLLGLKAPLLVLGETSRQAAQAVANKLRQLEKSANDADQCESDQRTLRYLSVDKQGLSVALVTEGEVGIQEAALVLINHRSPIVTTALTRQGDRSPEQEVQGRCNYEVLPLGLKVRVRRATEADDWTVELSRTALLGFNALDLQGTFERLWSSWYPLPRYLSFANGTVNIESPDLRNVSIDLDLRLNPLDITVSRRINVLRNGHLDLSAIAQSLTDEEWLKGALTAALAQRVDRQRQALMTAVEAQGLSIESLMLPTRDARRADRKRGELLLNGVLAVGDLAPIKTRFAITADGTTITPASDLTETLSRALLAYLPNQAELRRWAESQLGQRVKNLPGVADFSGRFTFSQLRFENNAIRGAIIIAFGPGQSLEDELTLPITNLKAAVGKAAEGLLAKAARDPAAKALLLGLFGEQLTSAIADMQALRNALQTKHQLFGLTIQGRLPDAFAKNDAFELVVSRASTIVVLQGVRLKHVTPAVALDYSGVQIGVHDRERLTGMVMDAVYDLIPAGLRSFLASAGEGRTACGPPRITWSAAGMAIVVAIPAPLVRCISLPVFHIGVEGGTIDTAAFEVQLRQTIIARLKAEAINFLPEDLREWASPIDVIDKAGNIVAVAKIKTAYLTGTAEITLPSFQVNFTLDRDATATQALAKHLQSVLGDMGSDTIKFTNFDALPGEIAAQVDVTFKLADVFGVTMRKVRVSPKGVKLTGVGFTLPGLIAVGPITITGPTVRIDFAGGGAFALGGRLSIAALDAIYHLRATIEGRIRTKELLIFGDSYLIEVLHIFKDRGLVDFGNARMELTSESAGVLKALIPTSQKTVVDAKAKIASWKGDAQLLGVSFSGRGEILFQATPQIGLAADVDLAGLRASGGARSDVFLRRPEATLKASLSVIVGTADISFSANPAYARAAISVLRLRLSVTVPTFSAFNPKMLKNLIENLLKPRISLETLKRLAQLKIDISFMPAGKGSEFGPPEPNSGGARGDAPPLPPVAKGGAKGQGERPRPPERIREAPWLPRGTSRSWSGYRDGPDGRACWADYTQESGKPIQVQVSPLARSKALAVAHYDALASRQTKTWIESYGQEATVQRARQLRDDNCAGITGLESTSQLVVIVDWAARKVRYAVSNHEGEVKEIPGAFETLHKISDGFRALGDKPNGAEGERSLARADESLLYLFAQLADQGRQPGAIKDVAPEEKAFLVEVGPAKPGHARSFVFVSSRLPGVVLEPTSRVAQTINQLVLGQAKAADTRLQLARHLTRDTRLVSSDDDRILLEDSGKALAIDERAFLFQSATVHQESLIGYPLGSASSDTASTQAPALQRLTRELLKNPWTAVHVAFTAPSPAIILTGRGARDHQSIAFIVVTEPKCVRHLSGGVLGEAVAKFVQPAPEVPGRLSATPPPLRERLVRALQGDRDVWGKEGFDANPRGAFPLRTADCS